MLHMLKSGVSSGFPKEVGLQPQVLQMRAVSQCLRWMNNTELGNRITCQVKGLLKTGSAPRMVTKI